LYGKFVCQDVNSCISELLVAKAKGAGRGVAFEGLSGIRSRVTVHKRQRRSQRSWGFCQLRMFVECKAELGGVRVRLVNPWNMSRACPCCGHVAKAIGVGGIFNVWLAGLLGSLSTSLP
jgi:IS605 OrfB family transposase